MAIYGVPRVPRIGPELDGERLQRRERDALRVRPDGQRQDTHDLRRPRAWLAGALRAADLRPSAAAGGGLGAPLLLRSPGRRAHRPGGRGAERKWEGGRDFERLQILAASPFFGAFSIVFGHISRLS